MEAYEKRYRDSNIERLIRDDTRKGTLILDGGEDPRGALHAQEAEEDILKLLRVELRGIARAAFRSMDNVEKRCKKYKDLGAADASPVATLRAAYAGVLRKLIEEVDLMDPREEWERKLDG